jgi:chorismate mutase
MSNTAPQADLEQADLEQAPVIVAESASPGEKIAAIRAGIDAVDLQILDLVARRLSLADGLGALKAEEGAALPVRPAREVMLLRRLIQAAPAPVDPDLVVELWRTLIAANVRRQAIVDVVISGGPDLVRLHDLARRHFGGRTRILRSAEPREAMAKAIEAPNLLAVMPWPSGQGPGGWWPALTESRFHKLHLVAGLPLFGPDNADPEACVFAMGPTEPAGRDMTLIIAFDPHHKAQKAMSEAGFMGREIGRSEPKVLMRVDGFVALDDVRVASMTKHGLEAPRVLGSYARV